MDKAEQRALAYAETHSLLGYDYDQTFDAVKYGYLQAEIDLALTWHDIDLIVRIHDDVMEEAGGTPKDFAKETLRRFLEQREKK